MNYQVVPFVASVASTQGSDAAAQQLQALINEMATKGYAYVSLESVQTVIEGNAGCFGFGATPARITSFSMVVFRK